MNTISEIWLQSKETFDSKTLAQILAFAGDGKLKDNNITSREFRDLLNQVPSTLLRQFADNCLSEKFDDGGFALQDVINQIGQRLGFSVEPGLYRGKQNDIGFDGIWTSGEGHSIVVEVKTTDAYRINLDTIAFYRNRLIESSRIDKLKSSILIIVGRQDTGDLEAQIRGSKHAWDIRLLSTDSLLKLLTLKETLNDTTTIQQINQLLKPREYTRIDELIELIFLTTKDLQIADQVDEEVDLSEEITTQKKSKGIPDVKTVPVKFHQECLQRIERWLGINLVKQTRISYSNVEKSIGVICSISRSHKQGQNDKFWFAFHPHQEEFLRKFDNAFIAYACGAPDEMFVIPFKEFHQFISNFWTTTLTDGRMYWHVVIHHRDNQFLIAQPGLGKGALLDITRYRI